MEFEVVECEMNAIITPHPTVLPVLPVLPVFPLFPVLFGMDDSPVIG
jgi:hypothetical protein